MEAAGWLATDVIHFRRQPVDGCWLLLRVGRAVPSVARAKGRPRWSAVRTGGISRVLCGAWTRAAAGATGHSRCRAQRSPTMVGNDCSSHGCGIIPVLLATALVAAGARLDC